jgi:hypothetical protein
MRAANAVAALAAAVVTAARASPGEGTARASTASSAPPFDLTPFETTILPAWVAGFSIGGPARAWATGNFSFTWGEQVPGVYGIVGVVHALSVVSRLDLTPDETDAWAAHINSFELPTGYFSLLPEELNTGYQPWHSGGWVDSALRILGASAALPPATAISIALGGEAVWNASILSQFSDPAGIWPRSHKVASIPAQLMINDPHWATTYADFFAWFWSTLRALSSPAWGYWCLAPNPQPPSTECLGGAFHIAFTLACGSQPIPNAAAMLNTSLALQDKATGLWGGGVIPGYMDQDGVYTTTRSSAQLGRARWDEVEAACEAYVRTAAGVLNNATVMLGPKTPIGGVTHNLAGIVTSVAECARWFPGLVVTTRPWVNTIDRGCFG